MTGDVTLNPTASCLVMTTEILRSMLYRGSEMIREVAWVIFDEIHYMRDKERGVVWEETLILLPDSVRFVFLSATIPNARQFADWIGVIHGQPCNVVYTDYRPTPLQHYLFPSGGEGIHLVVDEKGEFREENFQRALAVLGTDDNPTDGSTKKSAVTRRKRPAQSSGGEADLSKIVRMLMSKHYDPVIVFSFSKRECETNALQMGKLDFNKEEEKALIDTIFKNAMDILSLEDQKLAQIENILPLLKRGVGIHHSGLLPILKEVIEILFQEGLIKILFATETFSIGLNMPAKTVVFTNVRKFDGKDFRWISSGEYIQMSGRAGRRGLDERGIVILMLDEKMEPAVAKNMIKGQADSLNSAFHLTYNMILNMLRVEGLKPEWMLERCFFQFQNTSLLPELVAQQEDLESQRTAIKLEDEPSLIEYVTLKAHLEKMLKEMKMVVHQPTVITPFLQPGRLVQIASSSGALFDWGCIVSLSKKKPSQSSLSPSNHHAAKEASAQAKAVYEVEALVACSPAVFKNEQRHVPARKDETHEMMIIRVDLSRVHLISSIRIYLAKDLKPLDKRQAAGLAIGQVKKKYEGSSIPLLDPVQDLGIKDESFLKQLQKIELLEQKLKNNSVCTSPEKAQLVEAYNKKAALNDKISVVKKKIKETKSIIQMEELKCRKRVLRRLGYTTEDDVIEMKGRVACEISTGDELLLTELIFHGVFNELSVEQSVSLLSCFVFQERASSSKQGEPIIHLKKELAMPLKKLQESAKRIAQVSIECKLAIEEEDYVNSFPSTLMDVVFAWCKGQKFATICEMTDVFEGSIIRCLRRLEELLRQLCHAAKSIGNNDLENKFAQGINMIKRDIVFANSLYL